MCVLKIWNSVYLELGIVYSEHLEQCFLRICTVCTKLFVQCVLRILFTVYLAFGTVFSEHLVQCVISILYNAYLSSFLCVLSI